MTTILLVDDEVSVLDGLRRALRKEPYEIVAAASGKDALSILEEREVDVIISDEMMPAMTGTELLSICKDKYPDTIRIILTGKGNLQSAMNAIYDGWVYQFLQKPVNSKDLSAVLRVALMLRSLRTAEESKHLVMSGDMQTELLQKYGVMMEAEESDDDGNCESLEYPFN